MTTREDLESFLLQMGLEYDEVDEAMWMLKPEGDSVTVALSYSPQVVLLRIKIMELPQEEDVRLALFYRKLLELNATDILHGSYGIEGNDVILSDALQTEDLDFSEFRSSFDSMMMAATSHTPRLTELVPVAHEG